MNFWRLGDWSQRVAQGAANTGRIAQRGLRPPFCLLRAAVRVSRMDVTVNRTPKKVLAPNERNERNERKSCEDQGIFSPG
jgi:hypothetical protein